MPCYKRKGHIIENPMLEVDDVVGVAEACSPLVRMCFVGYESSEQSSVLVGALAMISRFYPDKVGRRDHSRSCKV